MLTTNGQRENICFRRRHHIDHQQHPAEHAPGCPGPSPQPPPPATVPPALLPPATPPPVTDLATSGGNHPRDSSLRRRRCLHGAGAGVGARVTASLLDGLPNLRGLLGLGPLDLLPQPSLLLPLLQQLPLLLLPTLLLRPPLPSTPGPAPGGDQPADMDLRSVFRTDLWLLTLLSFLLLGSVPTGRARRANNRTRLHRNGARGAASGGTGGGGGGGTSGGEGLRAQPRKASVDPVYQHLGDSNGRRPVQPYDHMPSRYDLSRTYLGTTSRVNFPPGCEPPDIQLSDESRLIQHLLYRYALTTPLARPVKDSSHAVSVEFQMTLVQILDFDETKQLIISNIWKSYSWVDENLVWDPAEYGGMMDLRLPPSAVWTPDIVLYNNADEQYDREVHHELLAVLYNGTIKWIPSSIYKSSCEVDMTNFPFDEQTCKFKFGSWTYDGYKVNLNFLGNMSDIDMAEFMPSSEWDILDSQGQRRVRKYTCCGDDPYPELIYFITIKRRTAFYIVVLILPCILLSCLTLVMFWFPPQRPDRTGLGMSLFSSFFVLLLILVQSSPPTSRSISLLGIYYCINMIMIAFSTLLSAVVINMFKSKGHKVSVPRCLTTMRTVSWVSVFLRLQGQLDNSRKMTSMSAAGSQAAGSRHAHHHSSGIFEEDDEGRVVVEWRVLATFIDRVFFVLYIIAMIASFVLVFPR